MNTTGIVKKYLENVPGYLIYSRPGTYNDKSYLSNIKYTMRPRTLNPSNYINLDEQTTIKINPGPGAYEKVETMTKNGKCFISKHKNSGATIINPACSKRFDAKAGN
jgi:hypothetical protein